MITGYIIGDKALIAKFDAMPAQVKRAVDAEVQRLGYALQAKVQVSYLRGPRPVHLGVKTGRLIGSITQGRGESRSRFETTADAATAFVGTNVRYGALWEYGFERKTGAGARGGKFVGMGPKALATYFTKHPPGVKHVNARPFLAPALQEMKPAIIAGLQNALKQAAVDALK